MEPQSHVLACFEQFDLSKDGKIDSLELFAVMNTLDEFWTRERVGRLLRIMDTDRDGTLSYDEFVKWVFDSPKAINAFVKQFRQHAAVPIAEITIQKADFLFHNPEAAAQAEVVAAADAVAKAGPVMLTVQNVSGDIVFGPQAVPGTNSVKDTKSLVSDPETLRTSRLTLTSAGKALMDNELLGDLGLPEDATFIVSYLPRDADTAEKCAEIISKIAKKDVSEIESNAKPVDIIKCSIHAIFLVLIVAYGEDVATERLGFFPFEGEKQDIQFYINKVTVSGIALRPLKPWGQIRNGKALRRMVEEMTSIDYDVIQEKLREEGETVQELKRLMDTTNVTSVNAFKASGASGQWLEWVEVAVKPFL